MPTAQSFADLRRHLFDLLTDDLAAALTALRDLLPEGTDKHAQIVALQGRLKDANKERIRNVLAPDEYQRRVDTVRAACYDLLNTLEPADLEPPAAAPRTDGKPAAREGSVLYRVPHQMPLQKPAVCLIRVAMDEDAILEDLVLDDDVRLRPRVEVSDMMRAELLDLEGDIFRILPLGEAEQLVREQGYTQWLFRVTPLVPGEHQLLVKVSMMEYNAHLGRYVPRDVSVLETVTIVTGEVLTDEADEAAMKTTGERVVLGPAASGAGGQAPEVGQKAAAKPPASRSGNAGLRGLAFALIFLLVGSAGAWALTPPPVRDWWVATWKDSAEAYQQYIAEHPESPYREKAFFRKADKTEAVPDLRAYLQAFPEGQFREQVLEKIETLEITAVESIQRRPSAVAVLQFLQYFPDSRRLPDVAAAAEAAPEVWQAVRDAVTRLVAEDPNPGKTEPEQAPTSDPIRPAKPEPGTSNPVVQPPTNTNPTQTQPGDARTKSGFQLVPVQDGTFIMGCLEGRDRDCYDSEQPAHTVTLSGFQIGKYEVTQADWREIMGNNPSDFKNCDDCPVEKVSWNDVQDFLKKLNATLPAGEKQYRLPTEAEWEYAARGGHKMPADVSLMSAYAGGNDLGKVAWYGGNSGDKTHPVGQKAPNALGLYDMSGNVWECCSDWHGDYSGEAQQNPKGPNKGDNRVDRGGSWGSDARSCRVANRSSSAPAYRGSHLGFRLCRSF